MGEIKLSKGIEKLLDKESRKIDKKLRKIINKTNAEEVYVVREGNKLKMVDQEEVLKDSLFPTLVRKAIKG